MLSKKLFITVYLIHIFSNIFIGNLLILSKCFFYVVLFNDVYEISRLIPKLNSWLNSRIILFGSMIYGTNTHNWIIRYTKHNYLRPNPKLWLSNYLWKTIFPSIIGKINLSLAKLKFRVNQSFAATYTIFNYVNGRILHLNEAAVHIAMLNKVNIDTH